MKWNDIFGSVSHQWADWTEGNPRRVAKTSRRGPRLRSQKKKEEENKTKKVETMRFVKRLSLSLSLCGRRRRRRQNRATPPHHQPPAQLVNLFFPSSYFILFLFFWFYFGCRVDLMESVWSAAFRVPRRPVRPFFRFLFLSFLPFFFVVRFDFWFRKSSARRQKSSFFCRTDLVAVEFCRRRCPQKEEVVAVTRMRFQLDLINWSTRRIDESRRWNWKSIRKKISFPNDVESEHWIDRIDRTERAMLPSYAITCYFINSSTRWTRWMLWFFLLYFFNAQRCASIGIDGSGFQCKSSMNFAKFLASNTQCCQVMRSLINSMNWWLLSFDNEKRQTMWPFFFIQENIRWKSEYFANLISWNPLLPYCCQEFPKKKKLKKKKKNRHYHPIIRLG